MVDIKKIDLAALRAQYVKDSLDTTFSPFRVVCHGPSSAGKTILAFTASRFWHSDSVLSDVAVVDVDGDATASLLNFGKRCPNIVPYAELLKDHPDPKVALLLAIDIAASIPGVEILVVDTLSVWGKDYEAYLRKKPELWTSKNGQEDTQKFWGLQSSANNDVAYKLRNTGLNFIVNFHSRALTEDLNKDAAAQERNTRRTIAQALPGEPTVTIEAVGAARDMWPKLVSLVLACRVLVNPKGEEVRKVYTRVTEDMQAKSRFNKYLAPVEEPDLGKMIDKIRNAVAAQQGK